MINAGRSRPGSPRSGSEGMSAQARVTSQPSPARAITSTISRSRAEGHAPNNATISSSLARSIGA